jgi:hypothetical protein
MYDIVVDQQQKKENALLIRYYCRIIRIIRILQKKKIKLRVNVSIFFFFNY